MATAREVRILTTSVPLAATYDIELADLVGEVYWNSFVRYGYRRDSCTYPV